MDSCIEIWVVLTSESSIFSNMAGWIAEVLFIVLCLYY